MDTEAVLQWFIPYKVAVDARKTAVGQDHVQQLGMARDIRLEQGQTQN